MKTPHTIILTSGQNWIANHLLKTTLLHLQNMQSPPSVIVITTPVFTAKWKSCLKALIKTILPGGTHLWRCFLLGLYCETSVEIAQRYAVTAVQLDTTELQDFFDKNKFLDTKLDTLISLVWPAIIPTTILNLFNRSMNYHNSSLPSYRGTYSTHWSMYNNENYTGYSFHRIEPRLDSGRTIWSNKIKINPTMTVTEAEWEKLKLATSEVRIAIEHLINDRFSKDNVRQNASYHSKEDYRTIITIKPDDEILVEELKKRLRYFGCLIFISHAGTKKVITHQTQLTLFLLVKHFRSWIVKRKE